MTRSRLSAAPVALVAALAALLAPVGLAQDGPTSTPATEEPTLVLAFDPAILPVRPGGGGFANLTIENPTDRVHEFTLRVELQADSPAPIRAVAKRTEFILRPGAREEVPVQVQVGPATEPGRYIVGAFLDVRNATEPTFYSAILQLDVRTTPVPASVMLQFEPFRGLFANPGKTSEGNLSVTALRGGEYRLDARGPPGFHVALTHSVVRLATNERVLVGVQAKVDDDDRIANGSHPLVVTATLVGNDMVAPARFEIPFEVVRPMMLQGEALPPDPATEDERRERGVPALALGGGLAVAGTGGAAWLLWARRRGWAVPLLAPLYTRIARNRVLEQPTREAIAKLVTDEPGITFSDLQRRLGAAAGQLTHHARMLEDAGVLFSTPDGQHRRFFHVAHGRVAAVPSLGERAMATLQVRGPRTLTDLARELGVSKQALHYHTKRLQDDGLLALDEDGRLVPEVRVGSAASPQAGRTDAGG